MKKAMITIEVLVSLLILFLVIATSFSNIKFFNIMIEKKVTYEDEYITVLSLRDKLSSSICQTSFKEENDFNGFHYIASCEKVKELKSFIKGSEDSDISGNIGTSLISLYRINLKINKNNYEKTHTYLFVQTKRLL